MRVARRDLPFFLLRTTMQPLMFVVVFGYLLPKMGFLDSRYTTALTPLEKRYTEYFIDGTEPEELRPSPWKLFRTGAIVF